MYQVRFHLGAGENHLKWQIKHGQEITYHSPEDVTLKLTGCKLRNRPGLARQIHAGAKKDVCAWVEAEKVEIVSASEEGTPVLYNPRRVPYWTNAAGDNLDNRSFANIVSHGRSLQVI
jgi:hypothetical protein